MCFSGAASATVASSAGAASSAAPNSTTSSSAGGASFCGGRAFATGHRRPVNGLWRDIWRKGTVASINKIKAPRHIEPNTNPEEATATAGVVWADTRA